MIGINSSEVSVGSSLFLLPTKCHKRWSHIYLSVWVWLEGQFNSIGDRWESQILQHMWKERHEIQEASQPKWNSAPNKMNWGAWVNDLWLVWYIVIRATKWYITVMIFVWNRGKSVRSWVLQNQKRARMIVHLLLNICSEICMIQLNAVNGMQERFGLRNWNKCLEMSKDCLSSVNGEKDVLKPGEATELQKWLWNHPPVVAVKLQRGKTLWSPTYVTN